MKGYFFALFQRDFKSAMNLRTYLIWLAMAGMGVFFYFASGGKTQLIQHGRIEFIALFLPQMIFGSWAVLSSFFDIISSDRQHNVLDCIMTSGISKPLIFISKVLATMATSLVLSFIYILPVSCVIVGLGGKLSYLIILLKYLLPLWGYIMVYAALGVMISVIARSSKLSLIWSLACGLLFMPRFFVMIIEGIGKNFGWTKELINNISMIAPGVMMQAL